jgi:predicted CoA-binding protein
MLSVKAAASAFLANKRIAVTGVSHTDNGHGSNLVYRRLRQRGYETFAVNPRWMAKSVITTLTSIHGGVDAVVLATRPEVAEATMRECAQLGIKHTWMHRSFGQGSVCDEATVYGREHGITVIDGGCPLMFEPTADIAHKLMRFVLTTTGKVPKTVPEGVPADVASG